MYLKRRTYTVGKSNDTQDGMIFGGTVIGTVVRVVWTCVLHTHTHFYRCGGKNLGRGD